MRKVTRLALVLAVVALAAALVGLWRLQASATQAGPATTDQRITIPSGSTLRGALHTLGEAGYIASPRLLELYLRCCGGKGLPAVKAGQYVIVAGSKPLDILQQLEEGRVLLEQLTLVEGWSFTQWRAALATHPSVAHTLAGRTDAEVMAAIGQADVFPEGRFAPDTYRFAAGTSDVELLRLAFDAQRKLLQEAWQGRDEGLPLRDADDALVLASIVEKETGLANERPRIAGVFVNRLRQGMRLQSDPTVIYGIRERYDGNIRRGDLTTDTPYNTYTRTGLPPTAIAMPGRDALWAAVHPEPGDAVFFVATGDGTGGHHFSSTLEEHNRAVQRYLQRLRAAPPGR